MDVVNSSALAELSCENNQLTGLDVTRNAALTDLYCGENQLDSLDISNNLILRSVHLNDMPSLYKVCVWELPFPPEKVDVNTTNSPNVYYTTDCN